MSLKQLMLATSVVALSLSGTAFAAGTSGSMQPSGSTSGMSSTHEGMSSGMSSSHEGMSNSSTAGAGASHSAVTQAQTALKEKGLYSGPIDGRIGPKTRQAISQFQRQNGLKQTAQLDSRTMSQLQGGGGTSDSGSSMPSNSSPSAPSGSSPGSGSGGMPPAGGTGGMH
jgi:peptidoglycan hydrolase-like protein with peptidoglycan-binding domain